MEPTTEAGRALVRELERGQPSEKWHSLAGHVAEHLRLVEQQAAAAERARIRAAVERLEPVTFNKGWTEAALSERAVLAAIDGERA